MRKPEKSTLLFVRDDGKLEVKFSDRWCFIAHGFVETKFGEYNYSPIDRSNRPKQK